MSIGALGSAHVGLTQGTHTRTLGERLEMKYAEAEREDEDAQIDERDVADPLAQLETRYATTLAESDRELLSIAMQSAADRAAMANGGLYLAKLAVPVQADALQALYAAQTWPVQPASTLQDAAEIAGNALEQPGENVPFLATLMGDVLEAAQGGHTLGAVAQQFSGGPQPSSSGAKDNGAGDRRELARRLLNTQDDSSLGYRYGVLPMLIAGQLVELDLAYFQERRAADRPAGLRRLAMTVNMPTLGRVEIQAQAMDDRLAIGINTESAASSDVLAAHVDAVRELASRLGWNVERVTYDFDVHRGRAARHIVDHVLNTDVLSRLA